jgi:glucokinase
VARAASSFVLLAIGTGLGGAAMIGDTLVRGHAGCAGEFGHIPVKFDGPACLCGRPGCVGAWVGGHVIASRARARLAAGATSALRDLTRDELSCLDARRVFEAAAAGDPLAREIVGEVCAALGAGLAAIMHALNPELVVVTGGVAGSLQPLEAELRTCVARHALPRALATTRLEIVPGDKRGTVAGGAALVLYELDRARASAGDTMVRS